MKKTLDLQASLARGTALLLDGATGTELARRGADTSLPLWSARALVEAPEVLRAIQREYAEAGAGVLTADTFRTHRRSLAKGGWGGRAKELTATAVRIAREAAREAGREVLVAGSIAPLEDCYSPDLVPPQAACEREHAELAAHLVEAGADLLLVETMNSAREARAAGAAARATGLPWIASFVCAGAGTRPAAPGDAAARLLGGEDLAEAVRELEALRPLAICVNCAPVEQVESLLAALRAATDLPIGAYANAGHVDSRGDWTLERAVPPEEYAQAVRRWVERGASLVGGCCGTGPEHIAAASRVLAGARA